MVHATRILSLCLWSTVLQYPHEMLISTTIVHQPTFNCFSSPPTKIRPVSLKPILSSHFCRVKLISSSGFVSNLSFIEKNGVLKRRHMAETVETSAFGSGSGGGSDDEAGGWILEQEALINGPANSLAGGFESTLNRLSKWLIAGIFAAILLLRHDAEALWAAMGSVLNSGISVILKHILNHERPLSTLRSDPGMPSSHAQSIFFTVGFAIVSVVQWLGINGFSLTISGFALAIGSYLSWLRVSQQLHTISQVVVGACLGSAFCALWFWSWSAFVLRAYESLVWVRIIIILGTSCFCLGFLLHVIRYWLRDER